MTTKHFLKCVFGAGVAQVVGARFIIWDIYARISPIQYQCGSIIGEGRVSGPSGRLLQAVKVLMP